MQYLNRVIAYCTGLSDPADELKTAKQLTIKFIYYESNYFKQSERLERVFT